MALRLPAPPEPPGHGPAAGPGPVVLFLPAHDEEATVAAVVARVPELVLGRRVECLVVDDGSGDRTAELAAAAGATVLSVAANRGLGAAVRLGLAAAVERGAAAVAFCDADREYDPAELERLVAPILEGPGRLRGRLPLRRRDPAHAAPAPPRQPGPHRPAPVRGPGPDRRRPERLPGPVAARPRPTPRSSTTTTTPRSSPSTSWPRATATWRSRSATSSAPPAARSSAPCATCARSSPTVWRELDRHHRAAAQPIPPTRARTAALARLTHPARASPPVGERSRPGSRMPRPSTGPPDP